MDLFSLMARLTLDSSQYKRGINESQGLFSGLANTLGSGAVAIGNLASEGISKAVGALTSFGKESISTGISFEEAMDQVAAISGTTGTKFDDLVAKAMEMGAITKFSATEAAEAFKYMAMAGWDADMMMAGIAGTMNLAAASGEKLGTVSDIVTDVLTAMGKEAGEAGHFANVLAKASSASNTNVSMMGETFKYAAPLAGALGYSIEDLALATGLMANAGIKGSQAGTSLRSILTRMANPPKQAATAMDKLGISLKKSGGEMKSFREVITDLREEFSWLTEDEQAKYAARIGGQEAMSGLLAIVNASQDDFERLMNEIDNSTGAAQTMAEIMLDNVGGALEELGGAAETLGLTIFDNLKEPLKKGIDWVTQNVNKLTEAYKEQGLVGLAESAGEALAAFIGKISEATPKIAEAAGSFLGAFGRELVEQAPSILANTSAGVANTLISGINAVFGTNIPDWNTLSKTLAAMISSSFDKAASIFGNGKNILSSIVGGIFGQKDSETSGEEKRWFSGLLGGLADTATNFFSGGNESKNILSNIVSGIFGGADSAGEKESSGFLSGIFGGLFGGIGDFLEALNPFEMISGWFETIATNIGTAITNIGELTAVEIPEEFTEPISNIATWWTTIADNILKAKDEFGLFIKIKVPPEFVKVIQDLMNKFVTISGAISSALADLNAFVIVEVPQKLLDSFREIQSRWEAIEAAIRSALSALEEFLEKDSEGFHSGGGRSHAVGLDYVPHDNYSAKLHRGEAVLTRSEAEAWREGRTARNTPSVVVNQYINSEAQTAADLMREARWEQERGILRAYV